MRTRLQRHVHSRPRRILPTLPAILERRPLGVQTAKLGVKSLADHRSVTHKNRSNQRVRADTAPPALRKLQSPLQVGSVGLCQWGGHLD